MKYTALFLFMVMQVHGASAGEGGVVGGGGKAVVCRDANHNIIKAEVLDVYEAENLYGLLPIALSGTLGDAVTEVKKSLKHTMTQPEFHLYPLIDHVQKIFHLVKANIVLQSVDDASPVFVANGCAFEQLANYVDDDTLLVSEDIWNHLDLTNRAALILHEAVYRLERYDGAVSSTRTRKFVGHVMSGFPFVSVDDGRPFKVSGLCTSMDGNKMYDQFFYYPNANRDSIIFQFYRFGGNWSFSKRTAVIPMSVDQFQLWLEHPERICSPTGEGIADCTFAGGEIISNFESLGSVALGVHIETRITAEGGVSQKMDFYLNSGSGNHLMKCLNNISLPGSGGQ